MNYVCLLSLPFFFSIQVNAFWLDPHPQRNSAPQNNGAQSRETAISKTAKRLGAMDAAGLYQESTRLVGEYQSVVEALVEKVRGDKAGAQKLALQLAGLIAILTKYTESINSITPSDRGVNAAQKRDLSSGVQKPKNCCGSQVH